MPWEVALDSLDIIIVNWNAGRQLHDCLASVLAADRSGFVLNSLVVVDNASSDGSAKELERFGPPLTVIRNRENRGFAAACNQGAKLGKADYLLFLNPDTRLYRNSLSRPVAFLNEPGNHDVGIVGIQLVEFTGQVTPTCARFPTPGQYYAKMAGLDRLVPHFFPSHIMVEWDHGQTQKVDQVMGAFFLIRRPLFEALGGFDERFFVYFEDVDLSLRARQAGWCSVYFAGARAYHKGGGTSGQAITMRLFYSLRSRIVYGFKHFPNWSAIGLTAATLMVEPISRLALSIARGSPREFADTLKAYAMLWREMPHLLSSIR